MRKLLILFVFFSSAFCFAQKRRTIEELAGRKVFINKKIISYTYFQSKTVNDTKTEYFNEPDIKNPYNIFINSDNNSATIRVNNKNTREDIILKFEAIYTMKNDENSDSYDFTGNDNCNANIIVSNTSKDNQILYLHCGNDKNSTTVMYTISKYDQL